MAGARRRKCIGEHADRHGKDQRRADSLHGPESNDKGGRRRNGAQRRCEPEYRDTCQQCTSAPEDVPDPARRHHEGTQRQHVDTDHPLQIRGVAVEVRRHSRQRQVHREVVDLDAEQRRRHRGKDPPGPRGPHRRTHAPTIRPATVDRADPGFCDASVTRETCVAIDLADSMFLQVGLGVLCFVV